MTNTSVVKKKDTLIIDCMKLLSKTYLPESYQYWRVKKSLSKLTNVELDCLFVMLLTSTE